METIIEKAKPSGSSLVLNSKKRKITTCLVLHVSMTGERLIICIIKSIKLIWHSQGNLKFFMWSMICKRASTFIQHMFDSLDGQNLASISFSFQLQKMFLYCFRNERWTGYTIYIHTSRVGLNGEGEQNWYHKINNIKKQNSNQLHYRQFDCFSVYCPHQISKSMFARCPRQHFFECKNGKQP